MFSSLTTHSIKDLFYFQVFMREALALRLDLLESRVQCLFGSKTEGKLAKWRKKENNNCSSSSQFGSPRKDEFKENTSDNIGEDKLENFEENEGKDEENQNNNEVGESSTNSFTKQAAKSSTFSVESLVPRGRRPNTKYPRVQACKSIAPYMFPLFPITQPSGQTIRQPGTEQ
ncbi:unnamed protein product [Meloidogyne enterolobii]|uniref:Uncharacterized protein n=1 Tax=Meloidogyne enterolobii TaxID=390850 RepID=A0ACB1B2M4_MELEN